MTTSHQPATPEGDEHAGHGVRWDKDARLWRVRNESTGAWLLDGQGALKGWTSFAVAYDRWRGFQPDEHTWRALFRGRPDQARPVREWIRKRIAEVPVPLDADEVDALILLASELFTVTLASGPHAVQMSLSAAGSQLRISASCHVELTRRSLVAMRLIVGLSRRAGLRDGDRTIWAEIMSGARGER